MTGFFSNLRLNFDATSSLFVFFFSLSGQNYKTKLLAAETIDFHPDFRSFRSVLINPTFFSVKTHTKKQLLQILSSYLVRRGAEISLRGLMKS